MFHDNCNYILILVARRVFESMRHFIYYSNIMQVWRDNSMTEEVFLWKYLGKSILKIVFVLCILQILMKSISIWYFRNTCGKYFYFVFSKYFSKVFCPTLLGSPFCLWGPKHMLSLLIRKSVLDYYFNIDSKESTVS